MSKYSIREKSNLSYDESDRGTIKIYRNQDNLEQAISLQERIFKGHKNLELLNTKQLIEKEPQLNEIKGQLVGGMYFPDDEIGDAHKFCKHLEDLVRNNGGRILTNTKINKISNCLK